jgi:NADPH-dependent F420 reductase
MTEPKSLAVLGGTGHEGAGIALRAAHAGWKVWIGSRDPAKAAAKADELNALLGTNHVAGCDLQRAAAQAAIIVLSVPHAAQQPTAELVASEIQGKILIDVTVPLKPPKVALVQLPAEGSCVKLLQQRLGDGVRLVSAFQNVSAHALMKIGEKVDCDVLVCADDAAAKAECMALVADMGLQPVDAGALANSVVAEALTSVLIHLNKTYKVPSAGIRITGLDAKRQ